MPAAAGRISRFAGRPGEPGASAIALVVQHVLHSAIVGQSPTYKPSNTAGHPLRRWAGLDGSTRSKTRKKVSADPRVSNGRHLRGKSHAFHSAPSRDRIDGFSSRAYRSVGVLADGAISWQ